MKFKTYLAERKQIYYIGSRDLNNQKKMGQFTIDCAKDGIHIHDHEYNSGIGYVYFRTQTEMYYGAEKYHEIYGHDPEKMGAMNESAELTEGLKKGDKVKITSGDEFDGEEATVVRVQKDGTIDVKTKLHGTQMFHVDDLKKI